MDLFARINMDGPIPDYAPHLGPCWIWTGPLKTGGYGYHREVWLKLRGPVAKGLHLDHLCRVHACVNPDHLEPVTCRENIMRSPIHPAALKAAQTHCIHGHEFTPENTRIQKDGRRDCRACNTDRQRRFVQSRKANPDVVDPPKGSLGNRKLTAEDVREIKRALAAGEAKNVLGRRYGVTGVAIGHIARGVTWRHIAA